MASYFPDGHFESRSKEYVPVAEFYADKSVFVTGGTGFIGKVLVEKLLRSCPKIKNIYLLMRPKRGEEVDSRLLKLMQSPVSSTRAVRDPAKDRPSEMNKIVPIAGDITEPELGISPADQAMLCQKVSVVFHSAATVKFDEKLKLSVTINMLGTQRLVQLCHRMLVLEVRQSIRSMRFGDIERNRPNIYTYTKALAEHMLVQERGKLPIAIVRPSIVLAAAREPMPGWLDSWNGPNGIIAAVGKGVFRGMAATGASVGDLVPVDVVANLMIACAWQTHHQRGDGVIVYNCCTGQQNPITWQRFVRTSFKYIRKYPFSEVLWYPDGDITSNRLKLSTRTLIQHRIPSFVVDTFARATGRKATLGQVHAKLERAAAGFEYFTTHQWDFSDDNVQALCAALSPDDRRSFDFDVKNIDWDTYLEGFVLGIRRFLYNDSPDTLPRSRARLRRLHIVHVLSQVAAVFILWRFLFSRSQALRALWRRAFELLSRVARLLSIA